MKTVSRIYDEREVLVPNFPEWNHARCSILRLRSGQVSRALFAREVGIFVTAIGRSREKGPTSRKEREKWGTQITHERECGKRATRLIWNSRSDGACRWPPWMRIFGPRPGERKSRYWAREWLPRSRAKEGVGSGPPAVCKPQPTIFIRSGPFPRALFSLSVTKSTGQSGAGTVT